MGLARYGVLIVVQRGTHFAQPLRDGVGAGVVVEIPADQVLHEPGAEFSTGAGGDQIAESQSPDKVPIFGSEAGGHGVELMIA